MLGGMEQVWFWVADMDRAVAFYTNHLGFKLEHQQLPAFANVSLGELPSCSADQGRRARARCLTGDPRGRAAGTGSSFASPT